MRLVVIGAGGHAKVVLATALEAGMEVVALLDDDSEKWGSNLLGVPIWGPVVAFRTFLERADKFILAIGDNRTRKKMSTLMEGVDWATLIHPRAYVHSSAQLGEGTVVFAGAVVQPEAKIGRHAIVNTGVVVEHDCRVGDWTHLASGGRLAGGVEVKDGAFLGAGVVVLPGRCVGQWSVVGAGAVVTHDLPDFSLAYGVPAEVKRSIQAEP